MTLEPGSVAPTGIGDPDGRNQRLLTIRIQREFGHTATHPALDRCVTGDKTVRGNAGMSTRHHNPVTPYSANPYPAAVVWESWGLQTRGELRKDLPREQRSSQALSGGGVSANPVRVIACF